MRFAVAVLIVLLAAAVRAADDDDQVLETKPLGDAIPERLHELEREWEDDVGAREPAREPGDDAASEAEDAEPAEPTDDEPSEARPAPKPPILEPPAHAKPVPGHPSDAHAPAHGAGAKDGKSRAPGDATMEEE